MTTTSKAVEQYLTTDLIVHQALSRGILNIRRAARWMIETQGWDTSEEAVVSALRRQSKGSQIDIEAALHLLDDSRLTSRTGLAAILIPRTREAVSQIPQITTELEPEDTLDIITEEKRVALVVDEPRAALVTDLIGNQDRCEVHPAVAELQVWYPEKGPAASAASAILLNYLSLNEIDVPCVLGYMPVFSMLVPTAQLRPAYKLVDFLVGS